MTRKTVDPQRLRSLLTYDPQSGEFRWLQTRSRSARAGDIAGRITRDGYRQICIDRTYHQAHRLAWIYVFGYVPDAEIDHKDHDRGNNRLENLRQVTKSQNAQNRSPEFVGTSGRRGVSMHRKSGKWQAQIKASGAGKYLGLFDTPEEAHEAYCLASSVLHTHNPFDIRARGQKEGA